MSRQAYPAAAQRRAAEVLSELGISEPPVDPDAIAARRNIEVITDERFPRDCFGALVRRGNTFQIIVSAGCFGDGHRRFTVAHELGHYHIDGHVEALLRGDAPALSMGANFTNRKDPFEVEADAFASELLMPTAAIKAAIKDQRPELRVIEHVADCFRTSLSSSAIRFAMVTDDPVVVVLSRDQVVEWAAFSHAFDGHRWVRRRWKGEWAPPRSGTNTLASKKALVASGERRSADCLLSEWFEGAPAVSVGEEAVGLGGYGRVLTLLTCADIPDADEWEEREINEADDKPDWRDALRPYHLG